MHPINDNKTGTVIDAFEGENFFLSNFYPSVIVYPCPFTAIEKEFATVEHLYQAYKATNEFDFEKVRRANTPGQAKRLGRQITCRPDWEDIKLALMSVFVGQKFDQNPALMQMLLNTGSATLIEGNYWGDTFWGVCGGVGKNYLGKILMNVRFGSLEFK